MVFCFGGPSSSFFPPDGGASSSSSMTNLPNETYTWFLTGFFYLGILAEWKVS